MHDPLKDSDRGAFLPKKQLHTYRGPGNRRRDGGKDGNAVVRNRVGGSGFRFLVLLPRREA